MSERHDMKVRNLDFSECRYLGEIYDVIKNELELPAWFGANPDALWDAVTGFMYTPAEVRISRTAGRSELLPDVDEIIAIFRKRKKNIMRFL